MMAVDGKCRRARVICHLPISKPEEEVAVLQILGHLQSQFKGLTRSAYYPPAFHGSWWDAENERLVSEDVILCMMDIEETEALPAIAFKLKGYISGVYAARNSPQDDVWVVAHQLVQYE
ncbi:MAG: hypothetical protein ACHQPI_04465 [Thermoanaerobaculia bacterium]